MTPSYALGLLFIFLVSVIWSFASVLVQYLYNGQHFDSPFLLTYIGTSLFVLLLPTRLVYERRKRICGLEEAEEDVEKVVQWNSKPTYQNIPDMNGTSTIAVPNTPVTMSDSELESEDNTHHGNDVFGEDPLRIQQSDNDNNDAFDERRSRTKIRTNENNNPEPQRRTTRSNIRLLSHLEHLKIASRIAPVWFLANWTYNASLAYTSITSSTVLASTGSLFTFIFALWTRDEKFSTYKLLGVALGVAGSILTGLHDASSNNDPSDDDENTDSNLFRSPLTRLLRLHSGNAGMIATPHHSSTGNQNNPRMLLGDALGLISAVGYGCYTVMIRVYCPRDERQYSMELLLGYIGLFNATVFSPIMFWQVLGGNSTTAESLTWMVFVFLVIKGLLDNVLSDYLWARSVVLTSATVASVGVALTIPLAFASDWILGHGGQVTGLSSCFGALAVLVGFILVNVGGGGDDDILEESAQNMPEEGEDLVVIENRSVGESRVELS